MAAFSHNTRRVMIAKTGTDTVYSASTDTTTGTYTARIRTCWQEVAINEITVVAEVYEDPATERDEPNTDERSVNCERPNRRLATVNRAGRSNYPRKAASSWG